MAEVGRHDKESMICSSPAFPPVEHSIMKMLCTNCSQCEVQACPRGVVAEAALHTWPQPHD